LVLDNLKSQESFSRVLLDLLLCASLSVVAHDQESGAGKASGKEHKGEEELGAQV
jgi:hypothetical protein